LTKSWRRAAPKLDLRFGWLVLLAIAAQLIVIYVPFGGAEDVRRVVFPLSYVLLLAFVALNWRRAGILIMGLGVALNFLAIVSNGGLMPVSPESLESAGLVEELRSTPLGEPVDGSKNVLLVEEETNLRWLTDRIVLTEAGPYPVFSIGDVVIVIGLVVTLIELILPFALPSRPGDRPSGRDRPSLT
jgi:hypothetical protein